MDVVPHGAVGGVALPWARHGHAAGGVGALVVCFGQLPAEPARHVDDEALLGPQVLILRSEGQELIRQGLQSVSGGVPKAPSRAVQLVARKRNQNTCAQQMHSTTPSPQKHTPGVCGVQPKQQGCLW